MLVGVHSRAIEPGMRAQDIRRIDVLHEEYARVVEQLNNQVVPIEEELRLTKEQLVWSALRVCVRAVGSSLIVFGRDRGVADALWQAR